MTTHSTDVFSAARRDLADERVRRDACANWLETFEWHAVAALTCDLPLTATRLQIAFRDEFHRRLTRVGQGEVRYFLVIEDGAVPGAHFHVHCLLYGSAALTIKKIERCWHRGFTHVTRFIPNGGATRYLASKLPATPDGWAFSDKLPPLRFMRRRVA